MNAQIIEIVQGDTRFPLEIQLWKSYIDQEDQGKDAPIDLTDVDQVVMSIYSSKAWVADITFVATGDPRDGKLLNEYWESTWAEAGKYKANVSFTYIDGGEKSMENLVQFKVRKKGAA